MKKQDINLNSEECRGIYERIKRRRFQILLHSYIYYRLNDSVIPNSQFDSWAYELIELQKQYPEISAQVELYDVFSNFSSVRDAALLPLDNDDALDARAKDVVRIYYLNK